MVFAFLFLTALGATLVVLGIISMKSSVSWIHGPKVAEENRGVFGKLMRTAQILGGTGVMALCLLSFLTFVPVEPIWANAGLYVTAALITAALSVYLYAMMKYYKNPDETASPQTYSPGPHGPGDADCQKTRHSEE